MGIAVDLEFDIARALFLGQIASDAVKTSLRTLDTRMRHRAQWSVESSSEV